MIRTRGQHPTDREIPASIRPLFLSPEQLQTAGRVEFHNRVMEKFEQMLNGAINLVVHDDLGPVNIDPVVPSPGRGSLLSMPLPSDDTTAPAQASEGTSPQPG